MAAKDLNRVISNQLILKRANPESTFKVDKFDDCEVCLM